MRIILFLFLAISLFGRDNPFFPADPNKEKVYTSNRIEKLRPYTTEKILFPNSARVIKGIIIRYQNLDGSIADAKVGLNSEIDWHEPFIISHKRPSQVQAETKIKTKIVKTKYVDFIISKDKINVKTSDKLLENFLLTNPHRVVMDFKRNTSFKPRTYKLNKAPFSKIRIGNHDGYYRVVIELDGQYRYKLETRKKEYSIVVY